MTVWFAIFLGLVQGITEFLPVSSSGHLAIFQNIFGLSYDTEAYLLFDMVLHLGTLVAVIIAFRRDVWEMIVEFGRGMCVLFGIKKVVPGARVPPARRLVALVIVACVPMLLGLIIRPLAERLYSSMLFIGIALFLTGILLWIADRGFAGKKTEKHAKISDAFIVGVVQLLALFPGISRSGITTCAGLFRRFDRKFAVRFSFLLSIPTIIGANVFSIGDAIRGGFDLSQIHFYIIGFLVSAISGYFAIIFVRKLIERDKFGRFADYCFCVGLAVTIYSIIDIIF